MEKKKITLSVAIAVYNEEKNMEACLSSVRFIADEIVVVDGGSTDRTVSVAEKFTSKIIRTDNPAIFHINKQKALDACTSDWILQIDADEVIPGDLKKEILTATGDNTMAGYYIPRRNFFWGHWMRKGGQYPDYVIRLVRRGKAHFPRKTVHEQIEVDGKVGYLTHAMDHFSYRSKEDYWRKADAYTSLAAMEMKKNGVEKNIWNWITYTILKPKLTFLSLFFRHKGFMDGWAGLVFAFWSALHHPIAYRKFVKLLLVSIFFLLFTFPVHAQYVLPYPSFMPGNKLYRITRIIDELKRFWYFGNIAQVKYHLSLADKYLVEAKTLMEYGQYLLGADALQRSDREFGEIPKYLSGTGLQNTVREASQKHIDVLSDIKVPQEVTWRPEKAPATQIKLGSMIHSSQDVRIAVASQAASL